MLVYDKWVYFTGNEIQIIKAINTKAAAIQNVNNSSRKIFEGNKYLIIFHRNITNNSALHRLNVVGIDLCYL